MDNGVQTMQSAKINSDIEILRAIAVLSVIAHHAAVNLVTKSPIWLRDLTHMFNGGAGVDLFFVISGFVIGRSYVSKMAFSEPNTHFTVTKSFFIRRAFRIYPLAWTWLAITLLATYFFNSSGVFGSVTANIEATIAGVFQFANYRFEQTFMRKEYGASFVYWSLSLEEQFYIALPLVMVVFKRFALPVLAILLAYKLYIIDYHFGFRYEGLLMGVIFSQCLETKPYQRFKRSVANTSPNIIRLICYGCIGLMFITLGALSSEILSMSKFKYAAALGLIVIAFTSCNRNVLVNKGRLRNLLCWIGTRSFALYLAHIPAFFITREMSYLIFGRQQPDGASLFLFVLVGLLLPFLFADLSYRFIETPMRDAGITLSKRKTHSSL